MEKFIFHEVFKPSYIDNVAGDDPAATFVHAGRVIQTQFTALVDVMRNPATLPLPKINSLMALFWDLVGNRICPTAVADVPTLAFFAEVHMRNGVPQSMACIMVPPKWPEGLATDPLYHMGGLVYAASQAKDYWNNMFVPGSKPGIQRRAVSAEAELLHFFKRTVPNFTPNEYQRKLIEDFPQGFASESSHYEGRGYDAVLYPPYPVDFSSFQ